MGLGTAGAPLSRLLVTLPLALALACRSATGNNGPTPGPAYSWRGHVVDAVTGDPVRNILISVREEPSHRADGLEPFLGVEMLPGGGFVVEYNLHRFTCPEPRDTAFTLHLDVADSAGQYEPATHVSQWLFNCDLTPPPDSVLEPYPTEVGLAITLEPR
jgi:hypothetical protein